MGQSKSKYAYDPDIDWPYVWALRDGDDLDWKRGLSESEILATHKAQNNLPVEISSSLFLGNCQYIQDLDRLETLGIRRVLNMAGPIQAFPKPLPQELAERGIRYKEIHAEDEEDYPLLDRHWDEAYAFIQDAETNNEKVLVHCIAGMNRSGLVVAAAHLLSTPDSNVIDTVRHIRKCRGNVALQNESFQEQLVAFARVHGRLGDAPQPTCPPPQKRQPKKELASALHSLAS